MNNQVITKMQPLLKCVRRSLTFLFFAGCLSLLFFVSTTNGSAQHTPMTIRVGAYENPPKIYTNREGLVVGIFPDILDRIAAEEGWKLEYVFGTWAQCLKRLEENRIDIMVDIASSEKRKQKFDFSDETIFLNWGAVYTRRELNIESLLDLHGKTVAVVEEDIHTVGDQGIRKLDESFNLDLTYVQVGSYRDVFEMIHSGSVDAGVVNRLYGSISEKTYNVKKSPIIFNPVQLKFAFPKNSPTGAVLAERIDDRVGAMKNDPDSVFHEIVNCYLAGVEFDRRINPALKTVVLTSEEKAWLRKHPVIRVGVDRAYAPYSFADSSGTCHGIAMDFLHLINKHLGIDLQVVDGLNWPQILYAAKNRTVDLVLTAVNTPERRAYLDFTKIYIPTPLVIMAREEDDRIDGPEDLGKNTVALVKGYSSADRVIKEHPSVKPLMVDTAIDGLSAVSVGEADFYVGVLGINDFLTREHGISNLKVAARYDMRFGGQGFGVRSDWPELVAILNKTLDAIPEKKKISIFNTWIPAGAHLEGPAALQGKYALTAEETAWIAAHPVIRLGADPEFAPFEFFSKSGVYNGIASDYVNILNCRLGLNLKVVPGLAWSEVVQREKNRQIDVLPCVGKTAERETRLIFSNPYINFHRVAITRMNMPFMTGLDDFSDLRVVVQAGTSHEGYLKENTDIQPVSYPTLQQSLRAVADGNADAFVGNIASASYWIRKQNLTNLKVAAPVSYEMQDLHFAVRKDWPMLAGIIDKGLASISTAKESKIRRRWIEVEYQPGLDPGDIWKYALNGIGLGILIIGAVLAWNYRLKKEIGRRQEVEKALQQTHEELELRIKERTADLAQANACLQQEISDRKVTEEEKEKLLKQLVQSQKMEAIGTMAGGIAHDFNNILMPILGYTELAMNSLPAGSKNHGYLQQVVNASHRARDLVTQILTFSRHDEHEKRPVRIQPLVKETIKLLRSSLPATIEIHEAVASGDSCILGCPTQIHQVVMNLCTNAYHAMRDQGGRLTVSVTDSGPDGPDMAVPPELAGKEIVRLSVADTGHGIAPAIKDRILEPYFTTKSKDEGTGLGLSMVHGIVKKYGGHLTFQSEAGKGTTFHVLFPKIQASETDREDHTAEQIPGGSEHIWVLDDDPMIAQMEKSMLEQFGYRVQAFTDGEAFLKAFEQSADRIDLILTDMTMPKMTGVELAQKIIKIRPDVPIVLCSGFNETIDEEKAKSIGFREFIMKPVVMSKLADTVRKVLDE